MKRLFVGRLSVVGLSAPRDRTGAKYLSAAMVVLLALLAPVSGRATPIAYTLVDAAATFAGGTGSLSGGFTFETSNHTIPQVSIVLIGFPPYDGTYDSLPSSLGSDLGVVDLTNSADMSISFANSLYAGAPDPITFVQISNSYLNAGAGHVDSLSVTGSAFPLQSRRP